MASIACLCLCARAGDVDIGRSLLRQGHIDEAREYLARAYAADSLSAAAQFAYAGVVADGARAERLYAAVERNAGAPTDMRCEAALRLGDACYCRGEYAGAYSWYEKAWRRDPSPRCGRLLARAALAMGEAGKAEAVLGPLAAGKDSAVVSQSLYYRGKCALALGRYEQAFSYFEKASQCADCAHGAAALYGAAAASRRLDNTNQMERLRQTLAQRYTFLLESQMLSRDVASGENPARTGGAPEAYTLQVGAFASLENARKLCRRLEARFRDVTIAAAPDGKLHRVRIGSFATESEAAAYGEKHLKSEGMAYRVIKK